MEKNSVTEGIDMSVAIMIFGILFTLLIGLFPAGKTIEDANQNEQENNTVTNVSKYMGSYSEEYKASDVFYEILNNETNVTIILNGNNLTKKKYDESWTYLAYVRTIDTSVLWNDVKKHDYYIRTDKKDAEGNVVQITFEAAR